MCENMSRIQIKAPINVGVLKGQSVSLATSSCHNQYRKSSKRHLQVSWTVKVSQHYYLCAIYRKQFTESASLNPPTDFKRTFTHHETMKNEVKIGENREHKQEEKKEQTDAVGIFDRQPLN